MNFFRLLPVGLMAALFSFSAQAEELVITESWVREGPPTAAVLAGYMRIHNPGDKDIVIHGAESPQFALVEIHRTEVVEGVARMVLQDQLVVPAGESIVLEPGGLHLMLIQPDKPLRQGDNIRIGLHLDNDCAAFTTQVRRSPAADGDHSDHHH